MVQRIAVIGFNLFAPGGTTRSNLNMMQDFLAAHAQVTYYNYLPFSTRQVQAAWRTTPALRQVQLRPFSALRRGVDGDVVFITRESFLPLAAYLHARRPALVVIGEIHTPLPQLPLAALAPDLPACNGVRVATPSVQAAVRRVAPAAPVYVQTVSLRHLPHHLAVPAGPKQDAAGHVNLAVLARFDRQKDIPYAIALLHALHAAKHPEFRLYINGYGPDKARYAQQIAQLGLQEAAFIGQPAPATHIALSTARLESLGYTIAEAFAAGYPVALYGGDDGVIRENFGAFTNCVWLTKDLSHDVQALVAFAREPSTPAAQRQNQGLLAAMGGDYVRQFTARLPQLPAQAPAAGSALAWRPLKRRIERLTYGHPLDLPHRVVYAWRRATMHGGRA